MRQAPYKPWWHCRRTIVSLYGLTLLFFLGMFGKAEVAGAMATVVLAVAGANASEAILAKVNTRDSTAVPKQD